MKTCKVLLNIMILSTVLFAQQNDIKMPFANVHISTQNFDNYETNKINKPQLLNDNYENKSVGQAFLYSLLLPRMGEAYVGETGYTKFFLATEAIGWGLLISNSLQADWLKKDY